jgi:serine/threonine protein kinase
MIKEGELYIIDFGFSTFYIDEDKTHVLDKECSQSIIGTPKYVSYFIHEGHSPSRRDDLISIGYMFMFLLCRELPWDNLTLDRNCTNNLVYDRNCTNNLVYDRNCTSNLTLDRNCTNNQNESDLLHYKNCKRKDMKNWITLNPICQNIDNKLFRFLCYCYQLDYDETPNYVALKQLFL